MALYRADGFRGSVRLRGAIVPCGGVVVVGAVLVNQRVRVTAATVSVLLHSRPRCCDLIYSSTQSPDFLRVAPM